MNNQVKKELDKHDEQTVRLLMKNTRRLIKIYKCLSMNEKIRFVAMQKRGHQPGYEWLKKNCSSETMKKIDKVLDE